MGRSGGGGGGHSSGGHSSGSHHGSSHHSSSFSGGSSSRMSGPSFHSSSPRGGYGGGYNRPPRDYGYRGGYGGPHYYDRGPGMPPPPPPRRYYSRSSGGGCGSFICVIFIVIILLCIFSFSGGNIGSGSVNDNNLSEYAEQQYTSIFNGREDCLLIVLDENDDGQIKYGVKANGIMDSYVDSMWDAYDRNYNDDLGIQLKGMFEETANQIKANNVKPIKSDKGFDSHCYKDDINWVDTKQNLVNGAKAFYDATGIQPYVLLVKARTISKATNKSSGVLKVFIIALAVVLVVLILFNWWKKRAAQKEKEQQHIENVLNTPLDTFGSQQTVDDLAKKYDDK